jgi:hypothetical protein
MNMNKRDLPQGTRLFFGAPANPMPEIISNGISQVVAQVPGIDEAHLPQCFIEGDKEARQVLVVGVHRKREIPGIAQQLTAKLQLLLPPGQIIDIFPFQSDSMPSGIREAGCPIFSGVKSSKKPWWKVW